MTKTTQKMMNRPEAEQYDRNQLKQLQQLVQQGEGSKLEFKRKANFPEKIIRELVAFANTTGGKLLVGISDDLEIVGVKFPDEDSYVIKQALAKYCRPILQYTEQHVAIGANRYVLLLDVPLSDRKPHYITGVGAKREYFVRVADKSIQASRELVEILQRQRREKGIRFSYGDHEQLLIQHLSLNSHITLKDYITLSGLNRYKASRKLILLVLANVLKITPDERGDLYSLVPVK